MDALEGSAGLQSHLPPGLPSGVRSGVRPGSLTVGVLRRHEAAAWRWSARIAVVLPLAALAFAVTVLVLKAAPAVRVNGWRFLTTSAWDAGSSYGATVHTDGVAHPMGSSYGAWPIIAGTLEASAIAVVVAVPLSLGAAFALADRLPAWLSRPVGLAIELLAGIPSVVIGLWGLLTLGPLLAAHVYPVLADHLPDVPVLRYFRGPVGQGEGLLTAGLVLALMIVPIITSTTRDLLSQVPPLPEEGGRALGMTDWEVSRRITVPWIRSGVTGAVALGLGRALGETVAVAMVTGSALRLADDIYAPTTTIAATVLTQLDGAQSDGTGFAVATLAELALLLAVISVLVNLAARMVIARSSRHGLSPGRG